MDGGSLSHRTTGRCYILVHEGLSRWSDDDRPRHAGSHRDSLKACPGLPSAESVRPRDSFELGALKVCACEYIIAQASARGTAVSSVISHGLEPYLTASPAARGKRLQAAEGSSRWALSCGTALRRTPPGTSRHRVDLSRFDRPIVWKETNHVSRRAKRRRSLASFPCGVRRYNLFVPPALFPSAGHPRCNRDPLTKVLSWTYCARL